MVLPDYRNRVIQGGDSASVLQPGLPNITGTITDSLGSKQFSIDGAFYSSDSSRGPIFASGDLEVAYWYGGFNASLSNAVYGASNTVQPPAINLIPQIKC